MASTRKIFNIKTLTLLVLLGATVTAFSGYQTNQVYKIELENKATAKKSDRDTKVKKVALYYMEQNERLWPQLAVYMSEATVDASEEYKIPLKVLVGKIVKESEANPFARSFTGAAGTSQVDFEAHKKTFPNIKLTRERYDPQNNIRCGAYLLQDYIKKYGIKDALHAYNLGETAYKKGKRNPNYVRDVLSNASDFEYYRI